MALSPDSKSQIITNFKVHASDTGSPEVQVALLTERISYLTEHFRGDRKDDASRGGLLTIDSKRKRLLECLKRHNAGRCNQVIDRLGIPKQAAVKENAKTPHEIGPTGLSDLRQEGLGPLF